MIFRKEDRAVFVYGFEKKDRANLRFDELEAFRELALVILNYTEAEISKQVQVGALIQISQPQEDIHA